MAISKCALAVITKRGRDVIPAAWNDLAEDEADFLERHVVELREHVQEGDARGKFTSGSTLQGEFEAALTADREAFVEIANRLVDSLATEMRRVNSSACVLAFIVEEFLDSSQVTLLKLDAEIEGARLEQIAGGIRLRVFDDLLPRPGEIQKGLSWPDPRSPESDVVLLDRVAHGSATIYLQHAYGIVASPASKAVEDVLRRDLAQLRGDDFERAVEAIGDGGRVTEVVARVRDRVPHFSTMASHAPADGAPEGYVRASFSAAEPIRYEANGIKLLVPPRHRSAVRTRREGTEFVTEIRTSTPLTPPDDE